MARTKRIDPETQHLMDAMSAAHTLIHWQYNGRKADAVETFRYDGDTYRWELWGAMSPAGGLLVMVHKHKGQSDFVTIRRFDDARPNEYAPIPHRTAYSSLSIARQRMYDANRVA